MQESGVSRIVDVDIEAAMAIHLWIKTGHAWIIVE
jgi:hypothetical protein